MTRSVKKPPLPRNMRQPSLMDAPARADMAFLAYHHANPHIYVEFRHIAELLYKRGVKHYGAKAIFEVLRYHTIIRSDEEWKINNNFTSRYARLLMAEDPRFAKFFELRTLRTEARAA